MRLRCSLGTWCTSGVVGASRQGTLECIQGRCAPALIRRCAAESLLLCTQVSGVFWQVCLLGFAVEGLDRFTALPPCSTRTPSYLPLSVTPASRPPGDPICCDLEYHEPPAAAFWSSARACVSPPPSPPSPNPARRLPAPARRLLAHARRLLAHARPPPVLVPRPSPKPHYSGSSK